MTTSTLTKQAQYLEKLPETLEITEDTTILLNTLNNSKIRIKNGANVYICALLTKGWEETQTLNFHFQEKHSHLNFIAIIIGKNSEKFPFETLSNHEVPETNGYYYVKSALFDKAKVNYKGCLIIKPRAQLTDSYLAHHTLMLSPEASTETIPSLEIEADDVKAGHAATLGQVDEETLHYMQTRGIKPAQAKDMLIKGFMEAELSKLPSEELRLALIKEIEKYID